MHSWYRKVLRTKLRYRQTQCLSCVSLQGSSPSSCTRHRSIVLAACPAAMTSPFSKWSRWTTSAVMCWEYTLLFPFPHSGCTWLLKLQAPSIKKQDISKNDLEMLTSPVLPPLLHLGVEELCQSQHALHFLQWIRQTFSLERGARLSVPLFSLLMSSQMLA